MSLIDIQSSYFDILERFVGQVFVEMKSKDLNPHLVAQDMASRDEFTKNYMPVHEKYLGLIGEFWESFASTVRGYVQELKSLKSVYGGDIFPSYANNIASSVGLYMDTILLPDPLIKTKMLTPFMPVEKLLYYTVKHALNALNYRELALADVEPPLIVIVPDFIELDRDVLEYLKILGEGDVVYHSAKLFGREFSGMDDLTAFLGKFSSSQEILSNLSEGNRLLFDSSWEDGLEEQYQRYVRETEEEFGMEVKVAQAIPFLLLGRMMQTNEIIFKASTFGGTSLIEAPTSWQYFLWKYEYDRDRSNELDQKIRDVMITKALQSQGQDELKLISGLPQDVLLELRKEGALAEFRESLRRGIDEIDITEPSALDNISEAVAENVGEVLTKHELELEEVLRSKRRFFGRDVSSFITIGGLQIAAASTGNIPLTVLSVLPALAGVGVTSAKDLWKTGKNLLSKTQRLKRSPTGILFRHIRPKEYSILNRYEYR